MQTISTAILSILYIHTLIMVSNQEQARLRVVQFADTHKTRRTDWKSFTAKHFLAEGMAKTTIYRILKRYEQQGSVARATGSGRPVVKMTRTKMAQLKRLVNHKTGVSQRSLAIRFDCTQGYISRTVKRLKVRCLKRAKAPRYRDDAAKREAMKRCRKMYNLYKGLDFVIDDEKYFGLTGFQMSGNRHFYTSDKDSTPSEIATFSKQKFEPKVMLWIAISPRGITRPVLTSGRSMAVTSDTYISRCLNPCLVPFLQEKYPNGSYVFWPDKASSHYSAKTKSFLEANGVNYVPKVINPTEVPQCRPIEDFFGVLATYVYAQNWIAKDTEALKRRIRSCIAKIPESTVKAASQAVRKRLLRAYRNGILSVCH